MKGVRDNGGGPLQPNPLLDNGMLKSPFESHASGQQHPPAHASPKYTKQPSNADTDAAAIAAAEAGDDLQALPDASRSAASAASLRATGPPAANGSFKSNPSSSNSSSGGGGGGAGGGGGSRRATRKLIPLNKVLRDSYEYHGLNDLFFFCITALAVTLVLYWHWGETTATFKATVQHSFQQYGNPDWQGQSLREVDTMYGAVEYSMGWLEFWLQRADAVGWSDEKVRIGEFADVQYVRMLVNIDRNCQLSPSMECYKDNPLTQQLARGAYGNGSYAHLLQWAGWTEVARLRGRESLFAGPGGANTWWAYPIIAPKFKGRNSMRDDYIGRMYNITRNTNLNYDNCDWANSTCAEVGPYTADGPAGPLCSRTGTLVPFNDWWSSTAMCANATVPDVMQKDSTGVARGSRSFVRHPEALNEPQPEGIANVLDLKPFLSKYAYSITLDVMAANAVHDPANDDTSKLSAHDMALFSMTLQRSAQAKEKPDRIMWQITSTMPVRTEFYSQRTDTVRKFFEVLLHVCLVVVLSLQVWQASVVHKQCGSLKPWISHPWNCFELLSNITLFAWVVFYWVLFVNLRTYHVKWRMMDWDVVGADGLRAHDMLNNMTNWSAYYGAYLYMGIVVDFIICLRLMRYMRIHVGLKAFYQVFVIAAREFLDFAVFLFYILILLGSAVFAFFQLTGGNYQFLRFPDGLSLMSRLTFGFVSYEEFQSQALGLGAAVSAVTLLFWVAVLLLVVYTQNIILAIVAEAYEEAKAKLGTADTSFLLLVLMRMLFTTLFIIYRLRMFFGDVIFESTGWQGPNAKLRRPASQTTAGTSSSTNTPASGDDQGPDGQGGASFLRRDASDRSNGPFGRPIAVQGLDQASVDSGLQPTESRAVLPFDVEIGLTESQPSRLRLLGRSFAASHQYAGSSSALGAASDRYADTAADQGLAAGGCRTLGGQSRGVGTKKPAGFWDRLSVAWHDVILGERHVLRMYNDVYLATGQDEDSWINKWKKAFWRPWCVARTDPVRCLMNLYQDFASYKLKEDCTWLGNAAAKDTIISTWRPTSAMASANGGSSTQDAAVNDTAAAVAGPEGAAKDKTADALLPKLQPELYVDEDTLSRLFLVTSKVAKEVKMWFSPFHELTVREVEYLVRGIAEVYGEDVDEELLQEQQALQGNTGVLVMQAGSVVLPDGSRQLKPTVSTEIKDAQLGARVPRAGGGFFNGLNQLRRAGGAQHGKQITWLLHANKRLEDATNRNAGQLSNANARLRQQMLSQESFQRQQQQTNSKLLQGLDNLHSLLQAQQQQRQLFSGGCAATSPRQLSVFAGDAAADRSSSGGTTVLSPGAAAGPSRSVSAAHRFNSMAASATSKVLAPFAGHKAKSSAALAGADQMALLRCPSDVSTPASPTAAGADGGVGPDHAVQQASAADGGHAQQQGTATAAAGGGSTELVLRLQQQLDEQRQTLLLQQDLLQQVLARLPPQQRG